MWHELRSSKVWLIVSAVWAVGTLGVPAVIVFIRTLPK